MRLHRPVLIICFINYLFLSDSYAAVKIPDTARHLVYPPPGDYAPTKVQLILGLGIPMEVDVSTIIGYVIKYNYNLPYNASVFTEPYVRRQRSASKSTIDDNEIQENKVEVDVINRYEIYKMLESAIDTAFQPGKACLLRAICEAATMPLNTNAGLFAQLLHVFLIPSSTSEQYEKPIDQEYLAAEAIGLRRKDTCAHVFKDCSDSFLEYISEIH